MPSTSRLMPRTVAAVASRCLLAFVAVLPAAAFAQSSTPAVSTLAALSGSQTYATPVLGPDGALYGVTSTINIVTGGLVYRLAVDGSKIETVYQLKVEDGYSPFGGLLLAADGRLYGTTTLGAANQVNSTGTVFRLAPDGTGFTVLHRFQSYTSFNSIGSPVNTDGANPEAELIEGSDGYLYGVARTGGPNGNGAVFKLGKDGTGFAVLHAFGATTSASNATPVTNADGIGPVGALVQGADGYFYGTAARGGATGSGTIFRVRFDGTGFAVMRTFPVLTQASSSDPFINADGAVPLAGLTDGRDGRLYGVASAGGSKGLGTVFAYDPVGGVFTVLHNFDGNQGAQPSGELLLGQDGKLYGTASTGGTNDSGNATLYGTIFSIARDGTGFTSIYSFKGSDGSTPTGRLLQLNPTTFVGITQSGGRCSQGTVYQLSLTGATTKGVTNCGRKNDSGGGAVAPALLLVILVAGLVRRATVR
jgi:uncharacterized repeat protein (TIGR03803 family)